MSPRGCCLSSWPKAPGGTPYSSPDEVLQGAPEVHHVELVKLAGELMHTNRCATHDLGAPSPREALFVLVELGLCLRDERAGVRPTISAMRVFGRGPVVKRLSANFAAYSSVSASSMAASPRPTPRPYGSIGLGGAYAPPHPWRAIVEITKPDLVRLRLAMLLASPCGWDGHVVDAARLGAHAAAEALTEQIKPKHLPALGRLDCSSRH